MAFRTLRSRPKVAGKVLDARILNGDLGTPFQGEIGGTRFNSFGFGTGVNT